MTEVTQNTNNETNNETAGEKKPKLTRAQKLQKFIDNAANFEQKLADAKAELASITELANVGVGSEVVIKLGRKFKDKDTTRYVKAVVIGEKDEDGKRLFKVTYGTGFDADVATVDGSALSLNFPEGYETAGTAAE